MVENTSGIKPTEYNILVRPHEAKRKIGSIHLPEDIIDKDSKAQVRGQIVATGPMAFMFEEWPPDKEDEKPKIGDVIYFARYAGANSRVKGVDGAEYWLIKDRDILAVIEE